MITDPRVILEVVSANYFIKVKNLIGRSKARELLEPRCVASNLLRECAKLTVLEIAEILDREPCNISSNFKKFKDNDKFIKASDELIRCLRLG